MIVLLERFLHLYSMVNDIDSLLTIIRSIKTVICNVSMQFIIYKCLYYGRPHDCFIGKVFTPLLMVNDIDSLLTIITNPNSIDCNDIVLCFKMNIYIYIYIL